MWWTHSVGKYSSYDMYHVQMCTEYDNLDNFKCTQFKGNILVPIHAHLLDVDASSNIHSETIYHGSFSKCICARCILKCVCTAQFRCKACTIDHRFDIYDNFDATEILNWNEQMMTLTMTTAMQTKHISSNEYNFI